MNIFQKLKNGLIVSCQADPGDPFDDKEALALFAKAAQIGGAAGIRSEGVAKTKKIISETYLPVIGLVKTHFDDGYVCITRDMESVERLIKIGCDIIAIDGTKRIYDGKTGPQLIELAKKRWDCTIMADISSYEEAADCLHAGADCLSTTLSGYTAETKDKDKSEPDFDLLKRLTAHYDIPVCAEGRVNKPEYAARMIELGAWAVVVGTAISRPAVITKWFVESINKHNNA